MSPARDQNSQFRSENEKISPKYFSTSWQWHSSLLLECSFRRIASISFSKQLNSKHSKREKQCFKANRPWFWPNFNKSYLRDEKRSRVHISGLDSLQEYSITAEFETQSSIAVREQNCWSHDKINMLSAPEICTWKYYTLEKSMVVWKNLEFFFSNVFHLETPFEHNFVGVFF